MVLNQSNKGKTAVLPPGSIFQRPTERNAIPESSARRAYLDSLKQEEEESSSEDEIEEDN